MKTNENQLRKEVVINLDELTIGLKAAKIIDKEGKEKVVISLNGKNYMGNYLFRLPIHIAAELIRVLETQQSEVIAKLTAQEQQKKQAEAIALLTAQEQQKKEGKDKE